ncbi:MAG: hypothetical protein JXB50_09375 [Spirochaetes bacterium]|nr:hypothetical protein [Spirochaetota bacterium]
MSLINKEKFEKNKDYEFKESVYELCKTDCCGKFCIKDSKILELFINPKDFNEVILINKDAKCPFCGVDKFKIVEIKDFNEIQNVKTGWEAYYN